MHEQQTSGGNNTRGSVERVASMGPLCWGIYRDNISFIGSLLGYYIPLYFIQG